MTISRVSPHALYDVIKFMTSEEKRLIRSLGFGSILEMGFSEIPSGLGDYVVNQFNHMDSSIHLSTGSIKITRESIHDMLGVPIGGKRIGSLTRPKKSDPTTQFWKEQFTEDLIRPSSVVEKMKKKKDLKKEDTKRLFILNFLVLFTTCMVEGNQLGTCNARFLSYITSIDEVSKIDWCGYILNRLIETGREWSGDEKGTYFCGSLSTLILHYLDSTKCASVCVPRKRPAIREWKTSSIKEREKAELETGFGQGEILDELYAEEENDEEEGHSMDTETETAAPKRKRNRPPKLLPKSPETSVTVYHQYKGVGPSANLVVEGAQVNEVSLPEPRNQEAFFGNLGDTMSDDRPLLGSIEGLNSPKSPKTSGTVNHQNEGVAGTSKISVVEGAQIIEVGFSRSRGTKSVKTNQDLVKEPNPKIDLNFQWGRKRHPSAKRQRRTISINVESSAQVDTRLDDEPLAGLIEEVHFPTTIDSPVGAFRKSDMDYENLSFVKSTPLWHSIESNEAFVKLPQKPHFRSLLEGVKESVREGLAFGMMVTFSTVVDKTSCLRSDTPRSAIEDYLETLLELESNGFDVEVIRGRLMCLLIMKEKKEALEDQSKGVVEKFKEHKIQEKGINEEVEEIDRQIRQLEENRKRLMLKKERWTSEIDAMKASVKESEKEIREVASEFDGLAAAHF